MTLLKNSLARKLAKHDRQTSQLAPTPLRKIICHWGVTTFFSLKVKTSDLYGSRSKTPPSLRKHISFLTLSSFRRRIDLPYQQPDDEKGAC